MLVLFMSMHFYLQRITFYYDYFKIADLDKRLNEIAAPGRVLYVYIGIYFGTNLYVYIGMVCTNINKLFDMN